MARVVVVTGGASGLGRALCHRLVSAGDTVYCADLRDDRDPPVGARYEARRVDVGAEEQLRVLVDEVLVAEGSVDLWVNNAAINVVGECADVALSDVLEVLRVNLEGAVIASLLAYEAMRPLRRGQIVNIASAAGLLAYPTTTPYSTAKAGLIAFSRALRAEARAYGVKVNVACPGLIDTPIFERQKVVGIDRAGYARTLPRARLSADAAAREVLRGAARNRAVHVFPVSVRAAAALAGLSPRFSAAVAMATLRRFRAAKGTIA